MDKLEAMTVFSAICDCGSLSAAARKMRMPLASVSRKLAELEAHLKTALLTRTTRKLVLTSAGHAYLEACRGILDQVDIADRVATGEFSAARGELVVGAPIAFGRMHVVPLIAEFLLAYPEIDVRLILDDQNANLLESHIDIAIRIGDLQDSGLRATRVGMVSRVVCASPAYLNDHGVPQVPHDLSQHECVTFSTLAASGVWVFERAGERISVPIRSRLATNTAEAALEAARQGLGVVRLLSYQTAAANHEGALTRVLRDWESGPTPVSVLYSGRQIPVKARAFLDFCVSRLRIALGVQT